MYAGHSDVPDVPLGTLDVVWMPLVAARGLVAFRRDRRIHTRPAEVRVFTRPAGSHPVFSAHAVSAARAEAR
ncbi:MAG: hypothetical protein ACRDRH_17015 [Pseudonocardia sp.]